MVAAVACWRCKRIAGHDQGCPEHTPPPAPVEAPDIDACESVWELPAIDNSEIWIWFADNGNIRKWSREPFPEGVKYAPVYQPFWENPDGPHAA